jgi:hypothetical protein
VTKVVHVNSPEFRDNPDAVYIGRRNFRAKDQRCHVDSDWGNWMNLTKAPVLMGAYGRFLEERIELYEIALRAIVAARPEARARLLALDGKTLGCWCKAGQRSDQPCHGDPIVKLIDELKGARR